MALLSTSIAQGLQLIVITWPWCCSLFSSSSNRHACRDWALPVDASPFFPALVPQLHPLASYVTQHFLPKHPIVECLVMLGHTGPTCSLEGLLVSTDVKLDVGTVGLVISRDIKLGLGIAFQVQSVNYQRAHHNSSTTKAPGFAGAMAVGLRLHLGKQRKIFRDGQSLWLWVSHALSPGMELTRGPALLEAQICFYSSLDPRVPNERKTVCAPGGSFLRQIYLLVGLN